MIKKIPSFIIIIVMLLIFAASCSPKKDVIPEGFVIKEGTKMIAHRGLSSVCYQNSKDAFTAAAKSDYFAAIETDIWFTSDNKWVCCHDEYPFEDTAVSISSIDYNTALKMKLSPSKSGDAKVYEDVFLCSFEDYLDICASGYKIPFIEIKCAPSAEQLKELLDIVTQKIDLKWVKFISFNENNLINLEKINSAVNNMVLSNNEMNIIKYTLSKRNIGMNFDKINQDLVNKIHDKGLEVNVYTVNDKYKIDLYRSWGVDYITTDYDFSTENK